MIDVIICLIAGIIGGLIGGFLATCNGDSSAEDSSPKEKEKKNPRVVVKSRNVGYKYYFSGLVFSLSGDLLYRSKEYECAGDAENDAMDMLRIYEMRESHAAKQQ